LVLEPAGRLDLLIGPKAAYGEPRKPQMNPSLSKKIVDQEIADRVKDAERLRLSRTESRAGGLPATWPGIRQTTRADLRGGPRPGGALVSAQHVQVPPELVDRMIEFYCDWRTGCGEVQAAYERFLGASCSDRDGAFAAYTAALDREQAASESYAEQVLLIQAACARPAEETPIAGETTSRLRRLVGRLASAWAEFDYAEPRRFDLRRGIPALSPGNDCGPAR
jgi:hypothetical protein